MAGPIAFLLLLCAVASADIALLTSPDRTGSEGIILIVTLGLGLILTGGASRWMTFRRNKDDSSDDP